ncbi:MAG: radical SAM protein [bacterium]
MNVCEIFASIQGESSHAGFPCVFVRLSGCNLRCSFCDTSYAYGPGVEMDLPVILGKVKYYGIELVEVTGGEPLIQRETPALLEMLCNQGYAVLLETNGSCDIASVDQRVSVVLDMKTPSSGMSEKMLMKNLDRVRKKDDVKFVLSSREDYEWSKKMMERYSLAGKTNVLLSPVFNMLEPEDLAQWMVTDRLNARLNLQLHKYIFGPNRRGV